MSLPRLVDNAHSPLTEQFEHFELGELPGDFFEL